MSKLWHALRQGWAASKWGWICLVTAFGLFCLDGLMIGESEKAAFTSCGWLSIPLVGFLARRIAISGKGHWLERLAIPLISMIGILWMEEAFYPLTNNFVWFLLGYIVPSTLYFIVILAVFLQRIDRFADDSGKPTNEFYVLKTMYTLIVWLTSIVSLSAGTHAFDPPVIAVSFSGISPLLAVLGIEMALRRRKVSLAKSNHSAVSSEKPQRNDRIWSRICLVGAALSVVAIGAQFNGFDEISSFMPVPDKPFPWIGWLSLPAIALFISITLNPGTRNRWLAVLFTYIWAFYGHFSLNVNYSVSPAKQLYTIVPVLVGFIAIIAASVWRARKVLVDSSGKINDFFEYAKSLASGWGWIMATLIVLVFSRIHLANMPIVLWGGIPLSVAPVLIAFFGFESYCRWRAYTAEQKNIGYQPVMKSLKPNFLSFSLWLSPILLAAGVMPEGLIAAGIAAFPLSALCVFRSYRLDIRFRWSFLLLGWLWSAAGIYVLGAVFSDAGMSPVAAGLLMLPLFTVFHIVSIWKWRDGMLHANGGIGEGFQMLKALSVCLSWLLGTTAFILYRVWSVSAEGAASPLLVTAIPLAIAPMVNGLYFMEAWFRSRQGKEKLRHFSQQTTTKSV